MALLLVMLMMVAAVVVSRWVVVALVFDDYQALRLTQPTLKMKSWSEGVTHLIRASCCSPANFAALRLHSW